MRFFFEKKTCFFTKAPPELFWITLYKQAESGLQLRSPLLEIDTIMDDYPDYRNYYMGTC